jgi:hypothetical protein
LPPACPSPRSAARRGPGSAGSACCIRGSRLRRTKRPSLVEWLSGFKQSQPVTLMRLFLFGGEVNGFFLVVDRLRKMTGLGVCDGQAGMHHQGHCPVCQPAGLFRSGDRPPAVSDLRIGTSSQDVCPHNRHGGKMSGSEPHMRQTLRPDRLTGTERPESGGPLADREIRAGSALRHPAVMT